MSWKKILKEQTTLGDFGMNRGTRQATFPQMERDDTAALQSEMPRIRSKLEAEVENVGENFANEARAMHDGDSPMRSIYGEAKIKDAQALIEDGIPVIPMPWKKRRTN